MSYAAERWARAQVAGNARAKAVLLELAHCLNKDTGLCYPSVARIAKVTELKADTVYTAIAHLVERGLIRKITSIGTSSRYEFVGFIPSEWPVEKEDDPNQKSGHPHKQGTTVNVVPPKSWHPRKRDATYHENGVPTHPVNVGPTYPVNGVQTGNMNREYEQGKEQGINAPAKNSPVESPCLNTNPNPPSLFAEDEPPLPFDDVPPIDDEPEGFFDHEADLLPEADPDLPQIATEAQPGPESEESEESEEGKPKAKAKRKVSNDRGCVLPFETLPDDWRGDGDELAPELDPDKCWVEFKDFWRGVPGAKGRKAGVDGWHRTWRNYLRKMADWKPKRLLKEKTAQSVLASKKKEYEGWLTRTI